MPILKKTGTIHDTLTGYDFRVDKPLSRPKANRLKCLECQNGNAAEVRRCRIFDCTLWPYRCGSLSHTARLTAIDASGDPVVVESAVRAETSVYGDDFDDSGEDDD